MTGESVEDMNPPKLYETGRPQGYVGCKAPMFSFTRLRYVGVMQSWRQRRAYRTRCCPYRRFVSGVFPPLGFSLCTPFVLEGTKGR